jgi:hypothetical protein
MIIYALKWSKYDQILKRPKYAIICTIKPYNFNQSKLHPTENNFMMIITARKKYDVINILALVLIKLQRIAGECLTRKLKSKYDFNGKKNFLVAYDFLTVVSKLSFSGMW